jgi:hypothetical protein
MFCHSATFDEGNTDNLDSIFLFSDMQRPDKFSERRSFFMAVVIVQVAGRSIHCRFCSVRAFSVASINALLYFSNENYRFQKTNT